MSLVLTGYNDSMASIGDLTSPIMRAYAVRHGYDFEIIRNFKPDSHPSWQKLELIKERLKEYGLILWLDADIVVTNHFFRWLSLIKGDYCLFVSKDWGEGSDFSCGAMIWQDNISADALIKAAQKNIEWENKPLWDQSALQCEYKNYPVKVLNRRLLNAVPIEIQSTAIEPWQQGDFLCHLTGITNEQRLPLVSKYDMEGISRLIGGIPPWYETSMMMDIRHIACIKEVLEWGICKSVLEIGVYKGMVTRTLQDLLQRGRIEELVCCDIERQPEYSGPLIQFKSTELLTNGGNWDTIILDGDHSINNVNSEIQLILDKTNVKLLILHDITAGLFDSTCQGPVRAYHTLRNLGWQCFVDFNLREGERTHRGLLIATKEKDLFPIIEHSMQVTCY